MSYPPALLAVLEEVLKITRFSVDDLPALEIEAGMLPCCSTIWRTCGTLPLRR